MNLDQLRSEFQISGISNEEGRKDLLEESLLKEGYQVSIKLDEESLIRELGAQPAHIIVVDLMYLDWKLPKLIESILQVAPEAVFIFYGPADLFERTIAYRKFGLIQFVPDEVFPDSFLTWACDAAVSHLYQRYQNEELLKSKSSSMESQGGVESLVDNGEVGDKVGGEEEDEITQVDFPLEESDLIIDATSIEQLFANLYRVVQEGGWKLAYFKFIANRYSFVLSESLGVDFASVKGVGLELSPGQAKNLDEFVESIDEQPDFINMMNSVFHADGFKSYPLFCENQLQGLLVLFGGHSVIDHSVKMVRICFEKLALKQRLDSLEVLDLDTELLTDKYYRRGLADEISRSQRLKLPLALLHIHVDDYEKFNSQYGVQHSSILMRSLASLVRKTSRVNDISARTAPHEIKVLLPHTDLKGAGIRAERLRRIIQQSEFPLKVDRPITISVGVSEYPSTCRDSEGLESASAKALQQVLENGGNKVCLASPARGFQPDFPVAVSEAK